jgi:hypothetical protein
MLIEWRRVKSRSNVRSNRLSEEGAPAHATEFELRYGVWGSNTEYEVGVHMAHYLQGKVADLGV